MALSEDVVVACAVGNARGALGPRRRRAENGSLTTNNKQSNTASSLKLHSLP